jgi:hypothetical protein
MAPAMYGPLEPNAFVVPADPGPAPLYTAFAMPAAIKRSMPRSSKTRIILCHTNIYCTCFRMLNEYTAVLLGWNTTMFIQFILN